MERVLKDLRIVSLHETIPYSAQLYCGIYEMPLQPGKYILLEWSPLYDSSIIRLPLKLEDIGSLRGKILRHILGDIIPPFVALDERLRTIWSQKAKPQFLPSSTPGRNNLRNLSWSGIITYLHILSRNPPRKSRCRFCALQFCSRPLTYSALVAGTHWPNICRTFCHDQGQ